MLLCVKIFLLKIHTNYNNVLTLNMGFLKHVYQMDKFIKNGVKNRTQGRYRKVGIWKMYKLFYWNIVFLFFLSLTHTFESV